jgi:hypothetical protein
MRPASDAALAAKENDLTEYSTTPPRSFLRLRKLFKITDIQDMAF